MRAWSKYVHYFQIESVFWAHNSTSESKPWHHVKHSAPVDMPSSSQLLRLFDSITVRGTQGSMYLGRKKQTQFIFLFVQDVNITFMRISLTRISLCHQPSCKRKKKNMLNITVWNISLLNIDHDKMESFTSLINQSTHTFTETITTANTLADRSKRLNYQQIQR